MVQSASVDNTEEDFSDAIPEGLEVEPESFVAIPEWVLIHPDLSDAAVRLYGLLRSYARRAPGAYPRRDTLAARLACSTDKVDRLAKQLVDVGAMVVTRRWKAKGDNGWIFYSKPGASRTQTSNMYRLQWHRPAAHEGDPAPPDGGTPTAAPMRPTPDEGRTVAAPVSRTDAAPPSRTVAAQSTCTSKAPSRPLRGRGTRTATTDQIAPVAAPVKTSGDEDAKVVNISRGTRLPEGWKPTEKTRQWTFAQGLTEREAGRILANFRDYWLSKPGKEGRKLNWELTWQRWVRTEIDEGRLARSRRNLGAVAGSSAPRTPIDS